MDDFAARMAASRGRVATLRGEQPPRLAPRTIIIIPGLRRLVV